MNQTDVKAVYQTLEMCVNNLLPSFSTCMRQCLTVGSHEYFMSDVFYLSGSGRPHRC